MVKVSLKSDNKNSLVSVTAFTLGGVEVLPDDDTALAKIEKYEDGELYFVKQNRNRSLFSHANNGAGILEIYKRDKKLKTPVWNFVKVKKNVYDLYAAYLRTKNTANLLQAQRAHQNSN